MNHRARLPFPKSKALPVLAFAMLAMITACSSAAVSPDGGTLLDGGSGSHPDGGALPSGVTLQSADIDPTTYWARWTNRFPAEPSFMPIGVFPAEVDPALLAAVGIDFFTPMRDDNAGLWEPAWTSPANNDMTHVNATPSFYGGGTFFLPYPGTTTDWGPRAAFNVYGDELDGNSTQFFDNLPTSITSNNQAGAWGGLTASAFQGANAASHAEDPSRPVYIQVTTTLIDGLNDYHYTRAEKQAICTSADIFSFDVYPLVLRGGNVFDMYDQVNEARLYCESKRPVLPFVEIDQMPGDPIYPKPAQTVAEVWNAIIAGASGIQYFDFYNVITDTRYTGNGSYPAGAMVDAIRTVNAQVTALAPVIYAPFANGYATATGNLSLMTKYSGGHFYLFAIPHALGSQTVTFTLAGSPSVTATVLNENRTVQISQGTFTDSFADENTVHVYEIP